MAEEDEQPIVIDNGNGFIKGGLSGDDEPKIVFPSIIGRLRHKSAAGIGKQDTFVGNEAEGRNGWVNLEYPIKNGIVTDWDDMERIWNQMFWEELRVYPQGETVLLTDPALNPTMNRERMVQVMFENSDARAVYIANRAILAAYAAGRTAGVVVESGFGTTQIVPVVNDGTIHSIEDKDATEKTYATYPISNTAQCLPFAGQDLTSILMNMLNERGLSLTRWCLKHVDNIKEQMCYVALDFEQEMVATSKSSSIEREYELPDGQIIDVRNERFRCPEALFQPKLFNRTEPGIHQAIYDVIIKCHPNIQKVLFENIILSGRNTLFPGFAERIQKEIAALASPETSLQIIASPNRKNQVWIGGSILSSLTTFKSMCISKEEYCEEGARIVHRKCI